MVNIGKFLGVEIASVGKVDGLTIASVGKIMGLDVSIGPSTFRFEVKTTGADTFQLPIYNGGTYDFHVVWGDGGEDDIAAWNAAAANHSYSGAGTWNVEITGTITGWRFAEGGDKDLIYDISEWGPLNLGNDNGYFFGCSNLTISATDILDLTNTIDLSNAFQDCSSLITVPSMNSWNVAAVTTMFAMFRGTSVFNQNIGSWDVGSVTTMYSMFYQATNFNQNIGSWNTSSVTNIGYMFYQATNFNQDISSWVMSLVTNMAYVFRDATNFNQAIGSWNTPAVLSTTSMFWDASAFDQDLGSWNIEAVTNMINMLIYVTLSTANYDALLIGWEAQNEKPNVTFHGGNSKYTDPGPAKTARDALEANGWNITDGGPA